jgi:sulfhydrogenase subunit alpha
MTDIPRSIPVKKIIKETENVKTFVFEHDLRAVPGQFVNLWLPDIFGKDNILELDENDELEGQLLHDAFDLKRAGNNLSTKIGGRAVHAHMATVGGFLKIPSQEDIDALIKELKEVRPKMQLCLKVFKDCPFTFERNTHFVSLTNDDFNFLEGIVCSTKGLCIPEKELGKHFQEILIPHSQAKGYTIADADFMVGALARVNQNKANLHPNTQKDAKEYIDLFPSNNIFHNNLAQAIETLHAIDHSIDLLENTKFEQVKADVVQPKDGEGIGVIEAPRGSLYYRVEVEKSGNIKNGNIIVPTAQNQINIENDIRRLVQDNIEMDKEKLTLECEKLIRAYDPCMSCATHFLKLKWIEE